VDTTGKVIDGAEVEIWQCDSLAVYHAPNHAMEAGKFDPNFAGFGATRSGPAGQWRFMTIRPVPYTIRAPHIHVKLRHPTFGEIASQLFIAGEPLNETDFLWPRISTPVWVIFTSTSPLRGGATSISTTSRGLPASKATAARDFMGSGLVR
jgi:protocatechuate 3,4-dioxygenase, beta subunit